MVGKEKFEKLMKGDYDEALREIAEQDRNSKPCGTCIHFSKSKQECSKYLLSVKANEYEYCGEHDESYKN